MHTYDVTETAKAVRAVRADPYLLAKLCAAKDEEEGFMLLALSEIALRMIGREPRFLLHRVDARALWDDVRDFLPAKR